VERRARLHVLALLAAALAGAAIPEARAVVFMTRSQALAQAFPGATIERRALILTDAEAAAVEARALARLGSKLANAYVAWHGDTLAGTAFFDSRVVRTMPAAFMIVVAPDTTVRRVDVLAFNEPADYQPPERWLALFRRRGLDGPGAAGDVRNLSGATLSARAVSVSVRLALALYEVVAAPQLASRATSGAR
jgi:hypothetical protein